MIMPYLHFNENCEEAFLLYQVAFGGEAPVLARYSDAPESAFPSLKQDQKNKIMHGFVMLTENGGISGSDTVSPAKEGSNVSIHVQCDTKKQAQNAFAILAKEGTVISELISNPPPHEDSLSGAVQDKYGFSWILSV